MPRLIAINRFYEDFTLTFKHECAVHLRPRNIPERWFVRISCFPSRQVRQNFHRERVTKCTSWVGKKRVRLYIERVMLTQIYYLPCYMVRNNFASEICRLTRTPGIIQQIRSSANREFNEYKFDLSDRAVKAFTRDASAERSLITGINLKSQLRSDVKNRLSVQLTTETAL